MRNMRFLCVLLTCLVVSQLLQAADYYFVGSHSPFWGDSENWSDTSGGASVSAVPGVDDRAIFDGNSGDCRLASYVNVKGIWLKSSYAKTIYQEEYVVKFGNAHFIIEGGTFLGSDQNITGNNDSFFKQTGGTFKSTKGVLQVGADNPSAFNITGGKFFHNNGTLFIKGTGSGSLNNLQAYPINNLKINVSTISDTSGTLYVDGNAHLENTSSTSSLRIYLKGDYTADGSSASYVIFVGNGKSFFSASNCTGFAVNKGNWKESNTLKIGKVDILKDFTLSGSYSIARGEVEWNSKKITLNAALNEQILLTNAIFDSVKIIGKGDVLIGSTSWVPLVKSDFEWAAQDNSAVAGPFRVKGNVTLSSDLGKITGLTLAGPGKSIKSTAGSKSLDLDLIINVPINSYVDLLSDLIFNGTQNLFIECGTLKTNGHNITTAANHFTIQGGLELKGTETITTPILKDASTVTYVDSSVSANVSALAKDYFNLVLGKDKTHLFASGPGDAITIRGVLSVEASATTTTRAKLRRADTNNPQWHLQLKGGSKLSDKADIADCNANNNDYALLAYGSIKSGTNTECYTDQNIDGFPDGTWLNSLSDGNGNDANNWQGNVIPDWGKAYFINEASTVSCTINWYHINYFYVADGYSGSIRVNNSQFADHDHDNPAPYGKLVVLGGNITIYIDGWLRDFNTGVLVDSSSTMTIESTASLDFKQGFVVQNGIVRLWPSGTATFTIDSNFILNGISTSISRDSFYPGNIIINQDLIIQGGTYSAHVEEILGALILNNGTFKTNTTPVVNGIKINKAIVNGGNAELDASYFNTPQFKSINLVEGIIKSPSTLELQATEANALQIWGGHFVHNNGKIVYTSNMATNILGSEKNKLYKLSIETPSSSTEGSVHVENEVEVINIDNSPSDYLTIFIDGNLKNHNNINATFAFTGSGTSQITDNFTSTSTFIVDKVDGQLTLTNALTVASITVESGILNLAGNSLISSSLTVKDVLKLHGNEILPGLNDIHIFAGSTIEFADGVTGSVPALEFFNLTLGSNSTHVFTKAKDYIVNGAFNTNAVGADLTVLISSAVGDTWNLKLNGVSLLDKNVTVSDSNASSGLPLIVSQSTDDGNNTNWYFGKVVNVTSTVASNKTYETGETIPILVVFDTNVLVTGNPVLYLQIGMQRRGISYTSGSGTNTLRFHYKVSEGDSTSRLEYWNKYSLYLDTSSNIAATTGGAAYTILPFPGRAGSLSFNKNIAVNARNIQVSEDENEDEDDSTSAAGCQYSPSMSDNSAIELIVLSFLILAITRVIRINNHRF